MHPLFKLHVPLLLAIALALGGCAASTQPVAYSGLASASHSRPNGGQDSGRMPYSYATAVTMNISASLGRMDASQAGVRIGAEDLLARLRTYEVTLGCLYTCCSPV